jgi:DNA repair exonuclease SbcCD nuclease subunit
MWWIDHKLNQEIFDGALQDAYNQAAPNSILLLHCNYNSPFATQESTLNLTREDAETLLEKFDYVLIGHEHMPRTDFDERVILLGNTHPTGFSDISDKFAYDFEIENGKVVNITKEQIWDENLGYLSLDWTELSELESVGPMVQFVEVKGIADQQHMPLIASQVSKIWGMSDNLLMVRNAVTSVRREDEIIINDSTRCQSIPERISTELAGTKLEPLWNTYLGAL